MTQEMYLRIFLRNDIPSEERNQIFELAKEPSR
jgi:hypothetical protein